MPTTSPPPKNTRLVQWYPTSKPSATPIRDLNNYVTGTLSPIPKHSRHSPPRRSISMVVQALPELQAVSGINERVFSAKAGRDGEHNNHNECEDGCRYDVGFKGRGGGDGDSVQYALVNAGLRVPTPIHNSSVQQIVENTARIHRERERRGPGGRRGGGELTTVISVKS
ncbi:hypothetical protein GX50_06051 [[Emmonsia] crescens]|uniref:Uncharacterized protein n=1 Tax=[Emmonsia] crescens TaxID=73230 RepID=A0A2B7ZDT4_9EURO|nr:hypothetical protein GX50_06051 [Emmonsia crescens]